MSENNRWSPTIKLEATEDMRFASWEELEAMGVRFLIVGDPSGPVSGDCSGVEVYLRAGSTRGKTVTP